MHTSKPVSNPSILEKLLLFLSGCGKQERVAKRIKRVGNEKDFKSDNINICVGHFK